MLAKPLKKLGKCRTNCRNERGGLTIFTAVLVLILMTVMLVYATRVGLFETRVSGNEVRQKEAFNVAEAALESGVMFLLSNSAKILSNRANVFPDGVGFDGDGWFAPGQVRWGTCTNALVTSANHPCGGDTPAPVGAYFYDDPLTDSGVDSLPVIQDSFPAGSTARLSALMCFIDLDTPGAGTCSGAPGTVEEEANSSLVITLLAYGYSDCTNTGNPATCTGEATVALPVSNYKKLSGSPGVPLVAKGTVPFTGTVEVVGNPNGGGVGVPLTTWVDGSVIPSPILSDGSWQTCEMEEWYHSNDRPDDVICADNNCMCGPGGNDSAYFLSWRRSVSDFNIGIDIIQDPIFPPDLFDVFFGVPRALYNQVKLTAQQIDDSDCDDLGPQSNGLIWINDTGVTCNLSGNRITAGDPLTIGSPFAPVVLVSTADETKLVGGVNIFGILYIFDGDPEGNTAVLTTGGDATVYGAVIVDGEIGRLQGNFQIVYNSTVIASAAGIAGLGSVNGGWRDFGLPQIDWPVAP